MKAGWKTSEFWLTALTSVAAFLAPVLPPAWRAVIVAAGTVAYSASRAAVKAASATTTTFVTSTPPER